ncbi:hypothetical protein MAXJ12_19488 [Mesorhizobium alhagi CCNWXJ12-2]|uniref:Uncharacterized protein n=1 Tax=Mesorhizobium alhagi CCNWXJ12-2 TaxID=1107882 RepID=H0HUN8_9HYPH|nr:hypothetical protein MAXJ12_19488 [Mesorhizobium alhagi CCNWXJ12-2]
MSRLGTHADAEHSAVGVGEIGDDLMISRIRPSSKPVAGMAHHLLAVPTIIRRQ